MSNDFTYTGEIDNIIEYIIKRYKKTYCNIIELLNQNYEEN